MGNGMLISRLCSTPSELRSKVSHMQIEWKDMDFGPINLYTIGAKWKNGTN